MNWLKRAIMRRSLLLLILAASLSAASMLPGLFAVAPQRIAPAATETFFVDRSGLSLGATDASSVRRSSVVPIEAISPWFFKAIVAAEDRRFYTHRGVDWIAVMRAGWQSLRCGCNAGGASTITMQVARQSFGIQNTIGGKVLQMWDAARIEADVAKPRILNAYVNGLPMGGNIYGVEAAARAYFGIPARDLDVAQASLLAGIPNDPVRLNPRDHWAAARNRQKEVLERMVAADYLQPPDAALAMRETLHIRPAQSELAGAEQLLFRLSSQSRRGALIRTTIDLPLQRFVQAQAAEVVAALSHRNVTQAAAIVIDNHDGDVLAYVGSADYFDDAALGQNDGITTLRQPGSALKPFLYEFALERGAITPATILADVPASYAIPNGELYQPEDYSSQFAGPVQARVALADSLNVPAVRVLSQIGVPAFLERLREAGFAHLRAAPAYYGLGLTLGAGEVSLWELTRAYVTLARSGSAIPLSATLPHPLAQAVQVGDPRAWRTVQGILSDRYARAKSFGVGSVLDMPFPAFVKTGTSSGYRDTWAVGGTSQYTVGVWVGNFSGAPMRHIAGVAGAGPLWNRIMLHLYEQRDPPSLPPQYAAVRTSAAAIPRGMIYSAAYDEWRARNNDTVGPLRVLFPANGDVFEDALGFKDPRRGEQQIEFRISLPRGASVQWLLNGAPLAQGKRDAFYWTVKRGAYTLTVRSGQAIAVAHFHVVPRPPHKLRGFAIAAQ